MARGGRRLAGRVRVALARRMGLATSVVVLLGAVMAGTALGDGSPPSSTSSPVVSGGVEVGQLLSATTGGWDGSPTSYGYQWRRCDDQGASCQDVVGATSSSYVLRAADLEATVRVVVTATNADGSDDASSVASDVVSAGGGYPAAVLDTSSLSHYWRLGEASGTSLVDVKGSQDATADGVTLGVGGALSGDADTAARFDGSTSVASADLDLSGTSKVTVEFWFKVASFNGDDDLAMEFTANFNGTDGGFVVDPNDSGGKFAVGLGRGSSRNNVYFDRPSSGAWHHYAFVMDTTASGATQIVPYVDGVAVSYTKADSGTGAGAFADSTLFFMSRNASSLLAAGDLDELAVYSDTLTATEVGDHYALGLVNEDPVAAFSASPSAPIVDQAVRLDASASDDADGEVEQYEWDFDGDSTYDATTSSPVTTHAYSTTGARTVRLRVTDDRGATDTVTHTVTAGAAPADPYPAGVLGTTGLAHYWRLGESSGSVLADLRGGSPAGATAVTLGVSGALTGDSDTAARFNGSTSVASAPVDLSGTSQLTVEFWLKVAAFDNNDGLALEFTPNYNGHDGGFVVDPNDFGGKFAVGLGRGGSRNTVYFDRPSSGAWHHYAFVMDTTASGATQIVPYVDGVAVSYTKLNSGTGAGAFADSTLFFMSRDASSLLGAGDLDDLALYADTLTATQIEDHFLAGAGNQDPNASFTATPSTAIVGQVVTFDASASEDPDGTIEQYEWDLDGDGNYGAPITSPITTHAYASTGAITARVRVTDDDDATATTTHEITIDAAPSDRYPQEILGTPDLRHYWRLGEASGTALADIRGSRTATADNVTLGAIGALPDDPDTAATFNGTSSAASASVDLSDTSQLTVEFWLKVAAFDNNDGLALELTPNFNANDGGFVVDPNDNGGKFAAGLGRGSSRNNIYFDRPSAGTWHHYAFVMDTTASGATQITPYVDGLPVSYTKGESGIGAGAFADATLSFMSRNASSLQGAGDLDEVALYAGKLSASRIARHFHDGVDGPCSATFLVSNGAWSTGSNWSTGTVPDADDTACIPAGRRAAVSTGDAEIGVIQGGGTAAVTSGWSLSIEDTDATSYIGTLSLDSGTVTGAADVTVLDDLSSAGGSITGTGTTTVASTATGAIQGGTLARTLVNEGSIIASNASWRGTSDAVLDNRGTFTDNVPVNNGSGLLPSTSGATPSIWNSGVFRKTSTSQSVTVVEWRFDNAGEVKTDSGRILFFGGGVPGRAGVGSWSDALLQGGSYVWGAESTIDGRVEIAADVAAPSIQGDGELVLSALGSMELTDDATTSHLHILTMATGTLEGVGDLTLASRLSWGNGTMAGAGTTQLASAATGEIQGGTLDRRLVNNGTIEAWNGNWYGTSNAVLVNHGMFRDDIEPFQNNGLRRSDANATPRIENEGTFEKRDSWTFSAIEWQFDNTGIVRADDGFIYLVGGSVPGSAGSGSWSDALFAMGSYTLGADTTVDGPVNIGDASIEVPDLHGVGPLKIDAGTVGSLTLTDAETTSRVDTFTMSGGTLDGDGSLMVDTSLTWGGGIMTGGGRTILAPAGNGEFAGAPTLDRVFVNRGTMVENGGTVKRLPGAVLDNQGWLQIDAEESYVNAFSFEPMSAPASLWNRGEIVKAWAGGTSYVDWGFLDEGVVRELAGQIVFQGPDLSPDPEEEPSEDDGPQAYTEYFGAINPAIPAQSRCSEADPVNCATGGFYESWTDLHVAGRGRQLAVQRGYDALLAQSQAGPLANPSSTIVMAPGWSDGYATRLAFRGDYVILHSATEATATFKEGSGGTYTAAPRVKASLATGTGGTFVLTYHDQTKDVFDGDGRLLRQLDRNGYATTLSYDGNGKLETVTNPGGRTLTYDLDGSGRVAEITDPLGRSVQYDYDANGDLVTVTDPKGGTTEFTYDDDHRILTMTDPRNHTTTNVYDADGRVTSQTDADGQGTEFAYAATSTTMTNARGYSTRYELARGAVKRVMRGVGTPQESTVTMIRDISGNVVTRTDPDGQVTTVAYDAAGNATEITDPLLRETTITYTANNDVETITDPTDAETTFAYDGGGNVTSIERALAGTSQVATVTNTYDVSNPGDLLESTDPTGRTTEYAYDADGRRVSATDEDGNEATTSYNAVGWPTSTVSPRGNASGADPDDFRTTFTYDDLGDVTGVEDPLGHVTETTYDANGNVTSVTEPSGAVTTTAYDEVDRPTLVTRDDASTLTFGYDAVGNRTSIEDGLDHETTFAYDALDRLVSQTDPLLRTTTYAYDDSDRQTSVTDAASRTTTFGYDEASQLESIDHSSVATADVELDYDGLGRRVGMTDGTGSSSWTYDSLGRLTASTDGDGRTLGYQYDLAGRLVKLTYPEALVDDTIPTGQTVSDPSVTREYDDVGRLASVTDWFGNETELGYDADGNLTEQAYANGVTATLGYDRAGQLTDRSDEATAGVLLDLPYTRTANGQVHTQNKDGVPPPTTETLAYDELNQLTQATTSAGAVGYTYDVADRLKSIDTTGVDTTFAYDAGNQLTTASNTATQAVTATYDYDDVGNRIGQQATGASDPTTLSYDQENRLTRYQDPAASTPIDKSYEYDGDGLRADLLWDRGSDLPLVLGDGDGLYVTGSGGLPLEQLSFAKTTRYYHQDQLGSTRALTDEDGDVVSRADYDPYGNPIGTSAARLPFGFAGQYTDEDTGLIYLRARWYDPATGQFITNDPIGFASGETNLYRYAAGNPANATDPTGLLSLQDVGDFASGVYDKATFGGTRKVRQWLGSDGVDYCSSAYAAGEVAGTAVGMAVGPGKLKWVKEAKTLGRRGAFRQAKRDIGVPRTQHPTSVGPAYDKRGNVIPGSKVYRYGEGGNAPYITSHPRARYPDGGSQPPHFHPNAPGGDPHIYYGN